MSPLNVPRLGDLLHGYLFAKSSLTIRCLGPPRQGVSWMHPRFRIALVAIRSCGWCASSMMRPSRTTSEGVLDVELLDCVLHIGLMMSDHSS